MYLISFLLIFINCHLTFEVVWKTQSKLFVLSKRPQYGSGVLSTSLTTYLLSINFRTLYLCLICYGFTNVIMALIREVMLAEFYVRYLFYYLIFITVNNILNNIILFPPSSLTRIRIDMII